MITHVESFFLHPLAKYAVVSRARPRRLIVFVHGWRGSAYDTWGAFDEPPTDEWWAESDLLFVDYDSTGESVDATATRLRTRLEEFYPVPSRLLVCLGDVAVREDSETPYEELVLVGHSLGGLVARRAVVDAIDEWRMDGYPSAMRPGILDARLRLFSPASAGFLPRGFLGALQVTPVWWAVEMFLNRGAYPELKQGSITIIKTQQRTEAYGSKNGNARSLSASILWANPEKVVATERYDTDTRTRTADGKNHATVCKPSPDYGVPYEFVKTGLTT